MVYICQNFMLSNLVVPSETTFLAKSKSFPFLPHCAEKEVRSAHPHRPEWGTLVSPPRCCHFGQHPAERNALRVTGEQTQKSHFDIGSKHFSPSATPPFSIHTSRWETAWTFSSSLCTTITRTPSRQSTRWHTRRKQCLSNKGSKWNFARTMKCHFFECWFVLFPKFNFSGTVLCIAVWISRQPKDVLEKEQEENIRVWVDPQRNSIHSIKWNMGKVQSLQRSCAKIMSH